jgi:hypothetical protein
MERVAVIRTIIDGLIERMTPEKNNDITELKRFEIIRSYGTSAFTSFLALKRGLNPELAAIIGLLLDIGRIVHQANDDLKSTIGALEAERILRKTGRFSEAEISTICGAIRSQNSIGLKENPYDRILSTRYGVAAVELIKEQKFGMMVSLQGDQITAVPIEDAVGRLKTVPQDSELIRIAKSIGVEFGD